MFPMEVVGAEGRSLREQWASGAHAHLGVCVPGFPSLFLMYGPNTNTSGGTAWTQCDSWYRDQRGRIVANRPGYMTPYAERLRVLDPREYEFAPPVHGPTLGSR
jgi:cation diffusion facilitator CzcD-associated flavoprotein CzcO